MQELSQEEKDRYAKAFCDLCLMMCPRAVGSRYYLFPYEDDFVPSIVGHCLPDDLARWVEQKVFEDEQD